MSKKRTTQVGAARKLKKSRESFASEKRDLFGNKICFTDGRIPLVFCRKLLNHQLEMHRHRLENFHAHVTGSYDMKYHDIIKKIGTQV